jgi:hypothetical protein
MGAFRPKGTRRVMLSELEVIVEKVANAPKPPLPGGIVERGPDTDTPDMVAAGGGARLLPAAVVLEYIDAEGRESVRRVTLTAVEKDGADPAVIALCHLRQDMRRFGLSGISRVIDPLGAGDAYASVAACLDRFRVDGSAGTLLPGALWDQLTVLMFFARCDGYMHPSERRVMLDFVARSHGRIDSPVDEAWEIIRRLYPDSRTMLNSARAVSREGGPEALMTLRAVIRDLIEADGVIHNDEALHAIELAYLD